VLGESQKSCTVLASEFGDFTRECGAQIWAMKSQVETTLTTEQSTGITCPEDLICWDVLNICSAIANASEPSDEVTAILGAILAKVNPNKFKAEAMSDPATEGVLSRFLAEWVGQGVSIPIVVNIMVVHDRIHGGQGARRAASVYSLLVLQLFSSYMPSLLDRPSVATAAGQVANEYLKLLKVYIERSKTGDHSTQSDTDNACEHSNISRDACSECSDAYDLLELPFGASKEDVSDAKRELAKTLHPDVWLDRRGSRFAEERLKHVNAACDHLLECHFSGEQGYGIQEDSIRATSHTTTADTSVETRGTTEYVPEMGEPLSGSTFWLWRSIRVFLRAVWRFTKIVLAILLGVVAAAIVLLTIFMALWEHWERESKGQRGQSDLGSMNTKLFSFLESVTWLPRQIWGGLMLVATILFFGLVFAGQAIMEFASSNRIACVLLVCLFGLGLMAWVFHKEWQAEFAPSPDQQAPTTSSTVLGVLVVLSCIGGLWFAMQPKTADSVGTASGSHSQAQPQEIRPEVKDPLPATDTASSPTQQPDASSEASDDQTGSAGPPADTAGEVTQADASDIQQTLAGWAQATNNNDLDRELSFYGDRVDRYFLARNVTREFVGKDKERFYRIGERFISYQIDNVSIEQSSPDEAVALLTKHWVVEYAGGNTHSDQTNSRLWLKQEQSRWVITGEQDLK
jgi:ketosteroid isomerase-like protein